MDARSNQGEPPDAPCNRLADSRLRTRLPFAVLALAALWLACLTAPAFAATYGYAPTTYSWIGNATHTEVTWGGSAQCAAWNSSPGDDDGTAPINIGFSFTFGATAYTQLRINSNGRLQFANNYCGYGTQTVGPPPTYPYPYPNGNMNNTMRMYGADFCPNSAAEGGTGCPGYPGSGKVTYASLGSAPYRYFVVTWSQMPEWNSGSSLFNVQVILYENGDFVYQYKDIANYSQGTGQVGWQLGTTDYDLVDLSSINSLAYTALRFYKPTAPIVEYRFDQCGGTGGAVSGANTVLDTSAVAPTLPGSPSGTITANTSYGMICTGFKFNGAAGTYVSVPHNAKLNQPYVSVAAWVRHSAAALKSWEAILAKGDTTYRLHLNGGCSINGITTPYAFTFGFNGGCGNADLNSGVVPVAGQWYHVVGTYDGATIKIFVNGVLMNSQALATTIGTNTYPLYLAENSQQTGRNWNGDIDEIMVFDRALPDTEVLSMYNNEVAGLERTGTLRACAICGATLGGYNAFENSLAAGSISGAIKTKIAGKTFATSTGDIRIVALNGARTAVDTTVNANNVRVDVLDASGETGSPDANGCYAGTTVITTTGNQTINNGVGVISPSPNIANSYPRARLRVYSPPGNPSTIGCSSDVFAIRPSYINSTGAVARDADWQTSGNSRSLDNVAASGGAVHAAGKPFSLSGLTARNAANAPTTNYAGNPTLVPGNLVLPDPIYCAASGYTCQPGMFSAGTWIYSSGVLSSNSAAYSEAGSFTWEVEDRAFANVDATDSTKSQRYFRSNAVIASGRFVPASYQLSLNIPTLQTFGSACATRSFTYLGQAFGYASAPSVGVRAMNGAVTPAQTANYLGDVASGGLWKLASSLTGSSSCPAPTQTCAILRQGGTSNFTTSYALGTATPGFDGPRLTAGAATIAAANNGSGTLSFGASDSFALYRNPTTPQAPYTAAVTLALQLDDLSEAGVTGNPALISGSLAATAIAFDAGNSFRYGVLKLDNAYGSELLPLRVQLRVMYWNTNRWVTNANDTCTTVPGSAVAIGNRNPAGLGSGVASIPVRSAGVWDIILSVPTATGSADVALDLGTGTAASDVCLGAWTTGPNATTGAGLSHLLGKWCGTSYDKAPLARIRFGSPKTPYIYMRERY